MSVPRPAIVAKEQRCRRHGIKTMLADAASWITDIHRIAAGKRQPSQSGRDHKDRRMLGKRRIARGTRVSDRRTDAEVRYRNQHTRRVLRRQVAHQQQSLARPRACRSRRVANSDNQSESRLGGRNRRNAARCPRTRRSFHEVGVWKPCPCHQADLGPQRRHPANYWCQDQRTDPMQ